ncbi:DUF2341 domain-containing protein [Hyphococcus formosus]|uniref:DUF2341 domain-containing protein n=1 Tax=Hyphococcus formosus TaxID=3143534 RepID=UPI00398AA9C5
MSVQKLRICLATLFASVAAPALAQSSLDEDWGYRHELTLDAAQIEMMDTDVPYVPVLVRIHSGILDFTKAKEDGSDIRFVNQADGMPLDYHFERYDPLAELAYAWVEVPVVTPGMVQQLWLYYGNDDAEAVADAPATYDGYVSYVLHLSDDAGIPEDVTDNNNVFKAMGVSPTLSGMVGAGIEVGAESSIDVQSSASIQVQEEDGELTFAAWIRPKQVEGEEADEPRVETVFSKSNEDTSLSLAIVDDVPTVRLGESAWTASEPLSRGTWAHLAIVADDETIKLFVDGAVAAVGEAELPALTKGERIGATSDGLSDGFIGSLDEVYRSNKARSSSRIALMANSQGVRTRFVHFAPEPEQVKEEHHNYFAILVGALTTDAWVIIILLSIMSAISWMIMFAKWRMFGRTNGYNKKFSQYFREHTHGADSRAAVTNLELTKKHSHSSLGRLFSIGQEELNRRIRAEGSSVDGYIMAPETAAAIRSAMSAGAVEEEQRLGRWMVLLTIAISGGPFLGLLGTVLGVMITFAGVAAAGEVNVTAIAPGIAAALLATVAGLAVAIPALFGYNYLTGQLDNILAKNQIFVDELEKNMAEIFRANATSHRNEG